MTWSGALRLFLVMFLRSFCDYFALIVWLWGTLEQCFSTRGTWTPGHAFMSSRLDYNNSLFTCLNMKELAHLQFVQNSAAGHLVSHHISPHTCVKIPLLASVVYRVQFKISVLTYWALHGQALPYISDLIKPYNSTQGLRRLCKTCWWFHEHALNLGRPIFHNGQSPTLEQAAPGPRGGLGLKISPGLRLARPKLV